MNQLHLLQLLHGIQRKLLCSEQALDTLLIKGKHMAVDQTITNAIKKIDDATNAIAARIQKLIDQANTAGSLSAAEVVAALQPEVDRLEVMAADPANPVPTP